MKHLRPAPGRGVCRVPRSCCRRWALMVDPAGSHRPTSWPCGFVGLLKFPCLFAIPSHADSLMLPALFAHTARDVGGIGAVPEVVPAARRQRGLQLLGPFFAGFWSIPRFGLRSGQDQRALSGRIGQRKSQKPSGFRLSSIATDHKETGELAWPSGMALMVPADQALVPIPDDHLTTAGLRSVGQISFRRLEPGRRP